MKLQLLLIFLVFGVENRLLAQDFTGQWKGYYTDNSAGYSNWGGEKCEYVLELVQKGNKVSGYSYTYFAGEGKHYYTICKLEGNINPKQSFLEVHEIERIKTNVPNTIRNCFQLHKLTFNKSGNTQILTGSWIPQPNQKGDCGFGSTELKKRYLKNELPVFNRAYVTTKSLIPKTAAKQYASNKATIVKSKNKIQKEKTNSVKNIIAASEAKITDETTKAATIEPTADLLPAQSPTPEYRKRNLDILKTIEVENSTFSINLYDNGEIDGDSISLYYNNKLILSNKRLTDKPIAVTLTIAADNNINELLMFAENLGTIPPNTALMIVTDGNKRYEIRITSDLQKNGVIHFLRKQN